MIPVGADRRGDLYMRPQGTKKIGTERLLLRPFDPADAESCIRNWAADPAVYRHVSQKPQTLEQVRDWLSTAGEAYGNSETWYWAIVEKASGEVIGEIFVDDFSSRNGWCELDWKIGSSFWQKGYATEAAAAVARHLLDEVGFHRIQAKCCVENPSSERVMQKIGMVKEGVLRGYFYTKDGRWCDVVLYALLSSDITIENP